MQTKYALAALCPKAASGWASFCTTPKAAASKYEDNPPVVCGAILAAEDKNFFSYNGVGYSNIPGVLSKLRFKSLLGRLTKLGRRDAANSSPIFPQGGSRRSRPIRPHVAIASGSHEKRTQQRSSTLSGAAADERSHGANLLRSHCAGSRVPV